MTWRLKDSKRISMKSQAGKCTRAYRDVAIPQPAAGPRWPVRFSCRKPRQLIRRQLASSAATHRTAAEREIFTQKFPHATAKVKNHSAKAVITVPMVMDQFTRLVMPVAVE